jgi:hypothetical protein
MEPQLQSDHRPQPDVSDFSRSALAFLQLYHRVSMTRCPGTSIAALYCNSETSNISAQAVEAIFLTYCITTISSGFFYKCSEVRYTDQPTSVANLLLTCLVAGKLLIVNRRANMIFGQQRQGYIYGSIATIM